MGLIAGMCYCTIYNILQLISLFFCTLETRSQMHEPLFSFTTKLLCTIYTIYKYTYTCIYTLCFRFIAVKKHDTVLINLNESGWNEKNGNKEASFH